jgi:hypothetical protein
MAKRVSEPTTTDALCRIIPQALHKGWESNIFCLALIFKSLFVALEIFRAFCMTDDFFYFFLVVLFHA